jgi:HD-GYP domain-containing protein (c-di-GMP phosphodiesterase class II)
MENNVPDRVRAANPAASLEVESRLADMLNKLGVCVRSMALYGRYHPTVIESVTTAYRELEAVLLMQPVIVIAAVDSYLAFDSFPIHDSSESLAGFARLLSERQVAELILLAGITHDELVEFADALSLSPGDLLLRGGIETELKKRNILHIRTKAAVAPEESREGKDPADIYEEALVLVEEAMRAVQSGLQIPILEIRSVVSDTMQSLVTDESALLALAGIRSYDRYLSEHSVNVSILSMMLCKDLGLDAAPVLDLGISALLHDVGKVFVDPEIVKKPGRLTEEEWMQIRKHPAEGARALAGVPDLPPLASTIALEHHVHVNGAGYPSLPDNRRAHFLSRLVSIVDTYDALTTERPYRERWTPQQAIAWMLYEAWHQYDRQLLARFASRSGLYPLGSLVRLVNGSVAVVIGGKFMNPTRPMLKVLPAPGTGETGGVDTIDLITNEDPSLEIDVIAQPVEVLLPYTDRLTAA